MLVKIIHCSQIIEINFIRMESLTKNFVMIFNKLLVSATFLPGQVEGLSYKLNVTGIYLRKMMKCQKQNVH